MELATETAERYVHYALTQMLAVAERLGDAKVNERPVGPETNSVAALVVHCCGLTEFWLGHVALGRPSARDRDSEFSSTATVSELRAMVDTTLANVGNDLRRMAAADASPNESIRQFMSVDDTSDASLVLHVVEELFQHLGHAELTADVLFRDPD